ncbi:MAG: FecR domain-containing protein, partial [Planctomycetota bacterium]
AEGEFRRRLAEPEFRRRLAEYAIDGGQLYELSRDGFSMGPTAGPALAPRATGRWPRYWVILAAASVAALLMASAWYVQTREQGGRASPEVGRIVRVEGQVTVEVDGRARVATEGSRLLEGETLHTRGMASVALLTLDDGTQVDLAGETRMECTRQGTQKQVRVREGQIGARVVRQPASAPLKILTPSAEILVLGTSLTLSADAQGAELGVHRGRVRLTRVSDGRTIEVAGGQYAVASPRVELVARPLPQAPDRWSADFEAGLPEQWRYGQWIGSGLPEGSFGAVRATRQSALDGSLVEHYRVTPPKDWTRGLFRIDDDTYLNFTYTMERPGWLSIMMGIRSDSPAPAHAGNFELQDSSWSSIEPGQWQTVSIPLTAFRRCVRGMAYNDCPLDPPPVGSAAYLFWFTTGESDRGLMIDRIWISRKGDAE